MALANRKTRFVAILTILLLSGFLATSLIGYFVAKDTVGEQLVENTLPLTSDNIYSEIQRDLLRPIFISSLMAQDTFLRDWTIAGEHDPEKVIRYLSNIQKKYGTVTAFFVSENTKRYYHPKGVIKTISRSDPGDSWYFRVRNMQKDYEINIDNDTADRTHLTVFINYKVYDYSGRYIGATGVGLALEAVKEIVETYRKRYGRSVYFIDNEGTVVLHGSDFPGPLDIRQRLTGSIATQLLTSPGGSYSFDRDGKTVYVNSRLVPEFGWTLIVEQKEDPSAGRILRTLLINLSVSLGITGLVLVLAYFTAGSYQRRLEEMATTDKLTGALNRQVFDEMLNRIVRASSRREAPLSLIMCDIDKFKSINDTFGHLSGDTVIRTVAEIIRKSVRASDVVCRWGGEEFLILLQDCNSGEAAHLAEKIRKQIEERSFTFSSGETSVTLSLGVTQAIQGEEEKQLLDRVDQALFAAKNAGRNRVEVLD